MSSLERAASGRQRQQLKEKTGSEEKLPKMKNVCFVHKGYVYLIEKLFGSMLTPHSMNSIEDTVLVCSVEGNVGVPLNQRCFNIFFACGNTHVYTHVCMYVCMLPGRYTMYMEKAMATHCSVLAWRIPGTG